MREGCGCPKLLAGRVFRQISALLGNSSLIFGQHKMLSLSEGPKGGRRKGGWGRKLSHFSFCRAFRCCVVYSPCFPVWGEEKVMTIYDAGPLAAGPLCGLLTLPRFGALSGKENGCWQIGVSRPQITKESQKKVFLGGCREVPANTRKK